MKYLGTNQGGFLLTNNMKRMRTTLLSDRSFMFDFIDQITVGMTSMFRDPQMWKVIKNDLLMLMKQDGNLLIFGMQVVQ